MQKVSRRRLAAYIAKEMVTGGSSSKDIARHVAAYLLERNQADQADLLLRDVSDILAKEYGVVSAEVTSAHPLSDELRKTIAGYVKVTENAEAVELTESVDPDLIGGVVIRTPGAEFDSSIRTQLRHLKSIKETRR